MTVGELREILETEDIDDDVEIKLALQPSYPMVGHIRNLCLGRDAEGLVKTLWIAASDNDDYGVLSLTSIPMTMKRRTCNGKRP